MEYFDFYNIRVPDIIEMVILAIIIYYTIKSMINTRAWVFIKGVIVLASLYLLAYVCKLEILVAIFNKLVIFFGMAVVVIIQPELRKLIEKLGANSRGVRQSLKDTIKYILGNREHNMEYKISSETVQELVKGCIEMGKAKTGALIVIENTIPLAEYIESGIKVDACITSQLLINIFEKNTPLHDGAVIIKDNKVVSATCYLPLSQSSNISKKLGTRHRAAVGITEVTDAFVIIVSEETGGISVSYNGTIIKCKDREKLSEEIEKFRTSTKLEVDKPEIKKRYTAVTVLSIFASIMIWFIAANNINPIITETFTNVPITVINGDAITSTNKAYNIDDGDKVNVTLKDRRNSIKDIEKSDISVIADMSKLSITNAVNLDTVVEGNNTADVKLSTNTISVTIDDLVTAEYNISVATKGTVYNGYYATSIDLDHDTIVISGAKSYIDKIQRVIVDVDKAGLYETTTFEVVPIIYDKNGDIMDNGKFKLNYSGIKATVNVNKTVKVPLKIRVKGNSELVNNLIDSVDIDKKTVEVSGSSEDLNKNKELDVELNVDIPLEEVQNQLYTKNVQLDSLMPDGIVLVDSTDEVVVSIKLKDYYSKELKLTEKNIKLLGKSSKRDYKMDGEVIATIIGVTSSINDVTVKDIEPFIDCSNLAIGENEVDIQFKSLNSQIFGKLYTNVIVTRKEN